MKRTLLVTFFCILLIGAGLRTLDLDRIPPGLYHDEAYSGLDALAILRGAGFPVFLEGNGGREPFFIYLHALSVFFLGPSPFALRIPAAFIGTLTLAAFFVLVRVLNANHRHSTGLALIATAGLAVSYWHLNFSRMGWRTVSLPLFVCLTFYFFWRARRSGKLRDYVLTGVFLGACLYTYLAARFLPFVITIFWLIELLYHVFSHTRRDFQWRLYLRNAILVVVAAMIVFAPLAIYFLSHPQALFFRVSDVTLVAQGGSSLQAIASNALRVAQMFYQNGDSEWRHGIARRPVLDWIIGIPFALGFLITLRRWREAESWFAFLWLGIMLLPSVLSKDAPDTQRAIGALPAVYLFVAWGLEWLGQLSTARWQPLSRYAIPAATVWVLVGGGMISFRDYFLTWANDPHAYYDYQGELVDLATWMNAQSQSIALPIELYAQSTVHFLTLSRYGQVRSFLDLSDAEKNKIAAEPKWLLSPQSSRSDGAFALLRDNTVILLDPGTPLWSMTAQDSETRWQDRWGKAFVAITPLRAPESVRPMSFVPYTADFDHRLSLVGYALDRNITPGTPYRVTFYWSVRVEIQEGIKVFLHLLDSHGTVVAGVDEPLINEFHSSLLPEGQVLPDFHVFPVDAALPPGKYALEIGVYQPANDSRLPVWMNGSRVAEDRVVIPLKVALPVPTKLATRALGIQFGDAIVLEGFDAPAVQVKPGETFHLSLFWKCLRPMDLDYTVFVHLLDSQSRIIAQADRQPQNGNYPTSIWDVGERVIDEVNIPIPLSVLPGSFKVAVGLYDLTTGRRMSVGQSAEDQVVVDVSALVTPN